MSRSPEAAPAKSLGVLLPLYASFAGLQALDAHSTTRALQNGAVEGNPLIRDLAGQPVKLLALKAGVTTCCRCVQETEASYGCPRWR